MPKFDPTLPVGELTRQFIDIYSVSGEESALADTLEKTLQEVDHLEHTRMGNVVLARTEQGLAQRVIIAGHLDTVPVNNNLPAHYQNTPTGQILWGRGAVDMKGGCAVMLALAVECACPAVDVTWVWYDNEEVSGERNGLGRLARQHPELLQADFAVLTEPTSAEVEGGCNGTLRVNVNTRGVRAHSARAWRGKNAIHAAGEILMRLAEYSPREVEVDGLRYRESLSAVGITGGVAGNVIPDECTVQVNYRFAPNRSGSEALAHIREVFAGIPAEITVDDLAEGARPGLDTPLARDFLSAVGAKSRAKYGWTDVARFSALGIPAVNYGPGDPSLAHADDERVTVAEIEKVRAGLSRWLRRK